MTRKWLSGSRWKWLNTHSKVTKRSKKSLFDSFESLSPGPRKSLSSHFVVYFEFFGVWASAGLLPGHKANATIRVTSIHWRSHLLPQNTQFGPSLHCDWNRAIGVHWCSIHSTWNFGMACEGLPRSLIWNIISQNRTHDLAHQNRTIAIASDFRTDGAESPEILQKEGVLGSEIAARNRKSLATFHRTLKSHCLLLSWKLRDFRGPRWASQSQIAKIAAISVR